MTPTRHCDDCVHFTFDPYANESECEKGNKLRFYKPRGTLDTDYGWKRKCVDFDFVQDVTGKWK